MKKIIKIEKIEKANPAATLANLWPDYLPSPSIHSSVYVCEAEINGQKRTFEVAEKFLTDRNYEPRAYFEKVVNTYEEDLKIDLESDCSTI